MAQYNFEGDIDNMSESQLEFINNVIVKLGYENSKVVFEPVGKAGDNYAASVKRISVEGNNGNFKMIAKIAPTVEIIRQTLSTPFLFRNEHIMYSEILPKMVQLQIEAGVPEEEQLKYAKCYGSFSEQPNEVILLEDLQTLNFTMLDKFAPLTNECVKSVLKNFAVLHSLSFVLKNREPERFDYYKANLIDAWSLMGEVPEAKIHFQNLENDAIAVLDDPEHKKILKHKVSELLSLSAKFLKLNRNNKYSIIQQGDAWSNNIMFKYEGDNLLDSILIDYQISKNTSPISDVMYMIFNCTDYESRVKNFYDWIDYYHSELDKSLSNFNLKANFIYPRDKLDADLKQYGKLQFGLSIVLASMLIRKTDDAAKLIEAMQSENMFEQAEQLSISSLDEESKTLFRKRVIGLINSFTEFGLL